MLISCLIVYISALNFNLMGLNYFLNIYNIIIIIIIIIYFQQCPEELQVKGKYVR